MSSLYDKQLEWKKSSSSRSKAAHMSSHSTDIPFAPTFFTSKDTVRKFPVSERVGALTAQAGDTHVERFAKARLMREEAERKVLGKKSGKPSPATVTAAVPGNCSNPHISSSVQAQSQEQANYAQSSYTSTTGKGDEKGPTSSVGDGSGSPTRLVSETETRGSYPAHTHTYYPVDGTYEAAGLDLDVDAAAAGAVTPATAGVQTAAIGITAQQLQEELDRCTAEAAEVAEENAAREFALMELLEKERKAWHSERVKLVQCIHLQQLELASRASAAQETAVTIAKDFASTIERYEERLLGVESRVQSELVDIKTLLVVQQQQQQQQKQQQEQEQMQQQLLALEQQELDRREEDQQQVQLQLQSQHRPMQLPQEQLSKSVEQQQLEEMVERREEEQQQYPEQDQDQRGGDRQQQQDHHLHE